MKNRGVKKPIAVNSIPGQVEQKLERQAAVWRRRCEGATMTRLAGEFGISIGAVHNYIEEARKQLREATIDLAVQEREQSLALIDTAIEQVMPHINGEIKIETEVHRVIKGTPQTFKITIDEWQARMKGCQVLVSAPGPQIETARNGCTDENRATAQLCPRRLKNSAPGPARRLKHGASSR